MRSTNCEHVADWRPSLCVAALTTTRPKHTCIIAVVICPTISAAASSLRTVSTTASLPMTLNLPMTMRMSCTQPSSFVARSKTPNFFIPVPSNTLPGPWIQVALLILRWIPKFSREPSLPPRAGELREALPSIRLNRYSNRAVSSLAPRREAHGCFILGVVP